ncbi:hypothetical protein RintRC_6310 [Richelia intracellularis]|nr:hypothetical protein RintRC_6310 [Richelia intracellularis]
MFLGYVFTPLAFMAHNHCKVFCFPSNTVIPVIKDWNEPLVGAQPTLPRHWGLVKSQIDCGKSFLFTSLVL